MRKTKDNKQGLIYLGLTVLLAAFIAFIVLTNVMSKNDFMKDVAFTRAIAAALDKSPRMITKSDLADIKFLSVIERQDSSTGDIVKEVAIGYDEAVTASKSEAEDASEKFEAAVSNAAYTERITDFSDLEYFPNLVQLQLESQPLANLDNIVKMPALTDLMLTNVAVTDYAPLANHPNKAGIDTLYLNYAGLSDISMLDGMTAMRILALSNNQIEDITPIASMTSLETVYLVSNQISDISPLANCKVLEDINIQSNSVNDISALSGISTLKTANLSYNQISDISALSGKTGLTNLNLSDNQISDISAVENASAMLTIEGGNNSITDISALANMPELQYALFPTNNIEDITPLKSLSKLWYVDFTSNIIKDIAVLADLPDLIYGALDDNLIEDFSAVNSSDSTRQITGENNQKADIEAAKQASDDEQTEAPADEETAAE